MLYFVYRSYVPNVASTNRALAYFRNLERMGIPVTVVYFLPDKDKSKVLEDFKFVKFKYYWEHGYLNQKMLRYVSFYFYLKHFRHHLKAGDKVYVYAHSEICEAVINIKNVKVYFEITECPEVSLPHTPIYRASLERHYNLCKNVDAILVISNNLRDYYFSKGVAFDKIHIVNMIVDATRFDQLCREKQSTNYIAYCGAATNNKDGVDELIKSFAILAKRHSNILLYIIGSPPQDGDEGRNKQLVRKLGVEDRVVFTGIVPSSRVPQLLKNATILALCRPNNKQAKYGFPTKLGEYLLTGTPTVITSVGDIPFFLTDGESALIAPPNNPVAFAEKLCWVLENPHNAEIIGKRGQKVALESFNAVFETKKLLDIILSI